VFYLLKSKILKKNLVVLGVFALGITLFFSLGFIRMDIINDSAFSDWDYWQIAFDEYLSEQDWWQNSIFNPMRENSLVNVLITIFVLIIILLLLFANYKDIWRFLDAKRKKSGN
jgi:hypothetical protein